MPTFLSRFCLAFAFALWLAPASGNTISSEQNAFNRVKLLERQILLSEQIGTAVCLMLADIKAASQSDKARGAVDLFATVQMALRTGDENMAILPETSGDVLDALNAIDTVFDTFRAATLQLVNNDLHSVPVSQVMRLDDTLGVLVRRAVDLVGDEYGQADGVLSMRTTQTAARRQTMLTQRVAKDLCYITIDINADEMREELLRTVAMFETTHGHLRFGKVSEGIVRPPAPAVSKKLEAVDILWSQLAALLNEAVSDETNSVDTLIKALDLSNKLLFKTKQVARSYNR